jgi:hypothetical protein
MAQGDPSFERFLGRLEATSMLSNVLPFPELKEAADDYEKLVNGTTCTAAVVLCIALSMNSSVRCRVTSCKSIITALCELSLANGI